MWLEIKLNGGMGLGTKQRMADIGSSLFLEVENYFSLLCLYLSIYWAIYLFVERNATHIHTGSSVGVPCTNEFLAALREMLAGSCFSLSLSSCLRGRELCV
jgi:hypothetical protein